MSEVATPQPAVPAPTHRQERDLWVGVDLGGTKMMVAIYDSSFELVNQKRKSTKGYEGCELGIERVWCELVVDLCTAFT